MKIKKKIIKNYFIQQLLALVSVIYIKLVAVTSSIIIKNLKSKEQKTLSIKDLDLSNEIR